MRGRQFVAAVLLAACFSPTPTGPAPREVSLPVAGSTGIGDPIFPGLGNGGYDVERYDIVLAVDPSTGRIAETTTISAVATEALESLSFDLLGLEASAVRAGSTALDRADFRRVGRELRVDLPVPVERGDRIVVEVTASGVPGAAPLDAVGYAAGWQVAGDGTMYAFGEPDGASTWFPSNDHPRDRAFVHLEVTAPPGWTVVSGGRPVSAGDGRAVFDVGRTSPYLVPLAIGPFERRTVGGLAVWVYPGIDPVLLEVFHRQTEIVAFLSGILGPFPFESIGGVVVDDDLPAALETVTLPTYTSLSLGVGETVVVHELAHQWVGDAIGIESWQDVWIKEGLATLAEWLWVEHVDGPAAYREALVAARSQVALRSDPPPASPRPDDLYNPSVYLQSGLGWAAVRDEVGAEPFGRFLRDLADRYVGRTLATGELMALVAEDLGPEAARTLGSWVLAPCCP